MYKNSKYFFYFVSLTATLLLVGCSSISNFFAGEDNVKEPAPLVEFTPELNVAQLWNKRVGKGTNGEYLHLTPAVDEERVFIADNNGQVWAFDRINGRQLWSQQTKLPISSGPSYSAGRLALGTNSANVLILDADTGATLFDIPVSNRVLAVPTISQQQVFVKSVDDNLYAFNLRDGSKMWEYDYPTTGFILHTSGAPQTADGLVVAGFADGKILVFDRNTSRVFWERRITQAYGTTALERIVGIGVDPVISQGVVYVAAYQGNIMALNLRSGEAIWQHPFSSYTGIALSSRYLFITDDDNNLFAFDRNNGNVVWETGDLFEGRNLTAPVIIGNSIAVADGLGYVHWLRQSDGKLLARVQVGKEDPIIAPPKVISNDIYVLTTSGRIAGYRVG